MTSRISTLVVTPNFDDFLSQALRLFGQRPIVCDHPLTLERINIESEETQIIHVHGTYWFYDCCNLHHEIAERAADERSAITIKSTLEEILHRRSPLIVGYSGWEDDAIMKALRIRLKYKLGTNIYWFCYKRKDLKYLPTWLRVNGVKFVVPADDVPEGDTTQLQKENADKKLQSKLDEERGAKNSALSAVDVFDAMIRTFSIQPPALTTDPTKFFADQLRHSIVREADGGLDHDTYSIQSIIGRLDKITKSDFYRDLYASESLLETFRNSIRSSDYAAALGTARDFRANLLDEETIFEVASRMWSAAISLDDESELELSGYDLAISFMEELRAKRALSAEEEELGADARYAKSVLLHNLHPGDEDGFLDEIIAKYRFTQFPGVKRVFVQALTSKADNLDDQMRPVESLSAYDEIISEFGDSTETEMQDTLVRCRFNRAITLSKLGRHEESIEAYTDFIERYKDFKQSRLRVSCVQCAFNKAAELRDIGRASEALAQFDTVVAMCGLSKNKELRLQKGRALYSKAGLLEAEKRPYEAIATLDQLIAWLPANEYPNSDELYGFATEDRAQLLSQQNDPPPLKMPTTTAE